MPTMAGRPVLSIETAEEMGLADQILTLKRPIENRYHEALRGPYFHIVSEEFEEPMILDRHYVQERRVNLRPTYGPNERILAWWQRLPRVPEGGSPDQTVTVLMASDIFMLGDPFDFQRFKDFVRSRRLLDAQARGWLSAHRAELGTLAATSAGLHEILACLGTICDLPSPDQGLRRTDREANPVMALAKSMSADLLPVRNQPDLAQALRDLPPERRMNTFKLLCFVEDPTGTGSLLQFLGRVASMLGDVDCATAVVHLGNNARDLPRLLYAIRRRLLHA